MDNINIKGGSICFYGDWFGRPGDNFHEIQEILYKNNILTIKFDWGNLTVNNPTNIENTKKYYAINYADKVEWLYIPVGNNSKIHKIIYQYINGHLIKSTNYGEHEIKIKSPYYAVYIG